jgi:hypothetical protein
MRHVPQRDEADCAIAVAAIIADSSYQRARRAFPRSTPLTDGIDVAILIAALESLRGSTPSHRCFFPKFPRLIDTRIVADRAAVLIDEPNSAHSDPGHWIAVERIDGPGSMVRVYDPEGFRSVALPRYARREWRVHRIVEA